MHNISFDRHRFPSDLIVHAVGSVFAIGVASLTATGVGAPVGATATTFGLATISGSLALKLVGSGSTLVGEVTAGIQTGRRDNARVAIVKGLTNFIPGAGGIGGDVLQDQVNDAAGNLVNSQSPRTCPNG